MLDLLISYINFLVLSIKYIVKKLVFRAPDPPAYISVKQNDQTPEEISFIIEKKPTPKYEKKKIRFIDYDYVIKKDKANNCLPLLIFKPPNHYPLCIIYCHGNSCDLGNSLIGCFFLSIYTNCVVINFEYPGYGICKNQPLSEMETYYNLRKAYLFVRQNLDYSPNQIIVYGFSLGTAVAFDLACDEKYPIAGLILQSPLLSCVRVLYNVNHTYFFDIFNSCDKAKNLKTLTFFIHGNKDLLVPYIHGRILAKIIPQEYLYDFYTVDGADHNNLFNRNKKSTYNEIRKFIQVCTGFAPIGSSGFSDPLNEDEKNLENKIPNMKNLSNSIIIKNNPNLNSGQVKQEGFKNYDINNSRLTPEYNNCSRNDTNFSSSSNNNINSTKDISMEIKKLPNNYLNDLNLNNNVFCYSQNTNIPFGKSVGK